MSTGDPTGPIGSGLCAGRILRQRGGARHLDPIGPSNSSAATDMAWQVRLHNAPQITIGGKITVQLMQLGSILLARSKCGQSVGNNAIDVEDF